MATSSGINEDQLLLRHLGLPEDFHGSLTRDEFHQISESWLKECPLTRPDQLPSEYIRKMCRSYNGARSYRMETTSAKTRTKRRGLQQPRSGPSFHPLDIEVLVFLWCCSIVRQDLAVRMWECRHAIPFSLKRNGITKVYMWPLQPIRMQWLSTKPGGDETLEETLVKHPIKSVCAMKVGDTIGVSKSDILNRLGSEAGVPMFFHKGMPASTEKKSSFVNGMIEVAWSLPEGTYTSRAAEPMTLFNLRGNALNHDKERQLLAEISDIAVIMCKEEDLMTTRDIVEQFIMAHTSVVIFITHQGKSGDAQDTVDSFLSQDGIQCVSDTMLDVVTASAEDQINDNVGDLKDAIMGMQSKKPSSLQEKIRQLKVSVNTDLQDNNIKLGRERASIIVDAIREADPEVRRQQFVPLQGEILKKIARNEQEVHELRHRENVPIDLYRDLLQNDIEVYREKQSEEVKKRLPLTTRTFLHNVKTLEREPLQIFLRHLKVELDDLTRETMVPLQRAFNEKLTQKHNPNTKSGTTRERKIDEALADLESQMESVAFGFEHILRELSQIYECCEATYSRHGPVQIPVGPGSVCSHECEASQSMHANMQAYEDPSPARSIPHSVLPELGFKIFQEGYHLEILDGDTMTVSTKWVEANLTTFDKKMRRKSKEVRIIAVSALGIENSGKSTFLNTLTGTQFNVKATRCSRGIVLKHVPVADNFRKELGCDFIFVIDTEGLKSQDRLTVSTKFDNIMTTFAIGMSDKTILNLKGNNSSYLVDALPVSVQAFLTMRIAGIHPHCMIVHQCVDSCHRSMLLRDTHKLEQALDRFTKEATEQLKLDNSSNSSKFKEVIHFDPNEDSDYMSSLHGGKLPMAPVSTAYSNDVHDFGKKLLEKIKNVRTKRTIGEFLKTSVTLWDEIQMEQFVFRFKSCLEAAAAEKLDEVMTRIKDVFDEAIANEMTTFTMSLRRCLTQDHCKTLKIRTMLDMEKQLDSCSLQAKKVLNEFFSTQSETFENILRHKREKADHRVEAVHREVKDVTRSKVEEELNIKEDQLETNANFKIVLRETVEDVTRLVQQNKDIDGVRRSEIIQARWRKAEEDIREKRTKQTGTISVVNDAHVLLREVFERHVAKIEKILQNTDKVASLKLQTFEIINEHVSKRWKIFRNNKSVACDTLQRTRTEVMQYLAELESQKNAYRKDMMRKTLQIVKENVRDKKMLTGNFEIDLAIAVSEYAKVRFQEIHSAFELRNDPDGLIGQMRQRFEDHVGALINEATATSRFAESVAREITEGLKCASYHFLRTHLTQSIKELERANFLNNKRRLTIGILIEIMNEKNNWNLIQQLVVDHTSFSGHMLEKRLLNLVEGHVNLEDTVAQIKKDIENRCVCLKKCLVELQEEMDEEKSLHHWLELFNQKSDKHVLLYRMSPEWLKDEKLNIQLLTEILKSRVDVVIPEAISTYLCDNFNQTLNAILCERRKELLSELIGCDWHCPFCHERCKYDINHKGPHKMLMHSIPFEGTIVRINRKTGQHDYVEEREIVPQTCQDRVTGNECFLRSDNTLWPYYRYEEVLPDLIIDDTDFRHRSTFWKWVVKKYPKNVSKYLYGDRKMQPVPATWRQLKRDTVIRELRDSLHSWQAYR